MLDAAAIERCVQDYLRDKPIPGLALAIVNGDEIAYAGGFGSTSVEDGGVPVTPETLFLIASVTKMLVGTAVMRLVEAGHLHLDAPISTYLPAFRISIAGMERRITLRHLLSHTSGLSTFRGDFSSRESDGIERFVRDALPGYPLLIPPESAWLYSNAGFALVALIAASVTDTPFYDLMREQVFDPLEMTRTTFDPLVAMTYPLAQPHTRDAGGRVVVEHRLVQNTAVDPAGGAFSTVTDLAQVARMYLNGGLHRGRRLLTPESVQLMWTPVVRLWTLRDEGYGLAFATETYKGLPLVRHNGGGRASYGSCFYLAASRGRGMIALANWPGFLALVHQIFDLIYELPTDAPATIAPSLSIQPDRVGWTRLAGVYLGHLTGLVEIRVVDHALLLTRNGKEFTLRPLRPRQYLGEATDGERLSVGFPGDASEPASLIVVDDGPCERIAPPPRVTSDPTLWANFVGTYQLPESALVNDATFTVGLTAERLTLTWRGVTVPCIPLDATRFACDFGQIAFSMASDGVRLELWRTMTAHRV